MCVQPGVTLAVAYVTKKDVVATGDAGTEENASQSGSDDLDAFVSSNLFQLGGVCALSCEPGFPRKVEAKRFFLSVYALLLSS